MKPESHRARQNHALLVQICGSHYDSDGSHGACGLRRICGRRTCWSADKVWLDKAQKTVRVVVTERQSTRISPTVVFHGQPGKTAVLFGQQIDLETGRDTGYIRPELRLVGMKAGQFNGNRVPST
jgi:hypothetical protein